MVDIFIIGSKGIPAKYGGFETFVDRLTANQVSNNIRYHVACMAKNNNEFEYNGARCFNVKVPALGSAAAVLYDLKSLSKCISYIKKNKLESCIIYILACRIGPFLAYFKKQLEHLNIKLYVNPDGHEWKRAKWNKYIRAYWKLSEKLTVKYSDLLVCDSAGIEEYIKHEYAKYKPLTTFIAYGADIEESDLHSNSPKLAEWYKRFAVMSNEYYLIVGRFVPENNYETIIKEFMKTKTNKDLVIISNTEKNKFYERLQRNTGFDRDKRIKFVGTVYDEQLLKAIRENAFAYFHGHEVGGTNPSLLEALASTKLNLLYDVVFNREVAKDGALYFNKCEGDLTKLIVKVEKYSKKRLDEFGVKARKRIKAAYSWNTIVDKYEKLLSGGKPLVFTPNNNLDKKYNQKVNRQGESIGDFS